MDFRYITDAITPEGAIALLRENEAGKAQRIKDAENSRAVPAYTTSAGWLGYGEDKMKAPAGRTPLSKGYRHFKLKVGGSVEQDTRRLTIARDVIGYDNGNVLMVDANQVWSVPEAIEYMNKLAEFKPWFIEEPTSPDDILGHKAIRDALRLLGIGVGHRRDVPEPRRLQAAPDGGRYRRLPDRCLPHGWRQRSPCRAAHGQEVQHPDRTLTPAASAFPSTHSTSAPSTM